MADAHADAERLVGPVDQVLREPEIQRMGTERIVGSGTDDPGQRISLHGGLFADRFGRIPGRVGLLPDDAGLPERSLPPDPSDADWPRPHDGAVPGVEVDPHLGDVDHQAGTGSIGEHESRRQPNRRAFPREPDVRLRVCEPELREPHRETSRNVQQRVLVPGDVDLAAAHHRVVRFRRPDSGVGRGRRSRHRDGGCENPGRGQPRRGSPRTAAPWTP